MITPFTDCRTPTPFRHLLLLLCLFIPFATQAEESLSDLLSLYKTEADLSHKTKKEAAGNLIIFTRSDLERMQVRSLYELLKRLPFVNYQEDYRGYANLFYENVQPLDGGAKLRIFLNDHEISSAYYGDNVSLISHMDLSFIDHVEVYQGYPSFVLSIEPTLAIIRLYSKDPNRELGSRVALDLSTTSSINASASHSGLIDNIAYYAHISKNQIEREKVALKGGLLSKNQRNNSLYFSAENQNQRLELQALNSQHDDFMGRSADGLPEKAQSNTQLYRLGWRSHSADDSLKLHLDYSQINSNIEEKDDRYLTIFPYFPKEYKEKLAETIFSASLKKQLYFGQHDLLFGLQFKQKQFDFKQLYFNDTAVPPSFPLPPQPWQIDLAPYAFNQEKTQGVFIEESFQATQQQRLIASAKLSHITRNGAYKNDDLAALRFGYIFSSTHYDAKLFHTRSDMPLEPYLLQGALGNANLNNERLQTTTLELKQKKNRLNSNLVFFYSTTNDIVYYDFSNTLDAYVNFNAPIYSGGLYAKIRYNSTPLNYLEIAVYRREDNITLQNRLDIYQGGYLRYVGSHDNIDLFAEISWSDKKTESLGVFPPTTNGNALDLNFAATYHLSKDLALILKGENLLDRGLANNHFAIDVFAPTDQTFTQVKNVANTSQQLWLSLEYLF